ncbi:MAG: glycosyltransferase family 4 protein, partial [bacterium]|nr:glycosyltransferase family 4 protein [bacterium]
RFHHSCFDDPSDAAGYYAALDLYLVSSRAEGGPKALMESMASGIPLVTTNVGMAPDMVLDGFNAFMAPVDDVDELVKKAETLINSSELRSKFVQNGFVTVQKYDWSVIATSYMNDLYAGLIDDK